MKNRILLAIFSGVLLSLGWPTFPFTFLLFFGFVPLFIVHETIEKLPVKKKGTLFFRYVFLALLTWNIGTTWWVWNASAGGVVMAILANSLLMTIPFSLYHKATKYLPSFTSKLLLIVFWLCFEFCHQRWDLTWTWINIGNAFALYPSLIQWYEYTGALGGTVWVFLANVLFFEIVRSKSRQRNSIYLVLWIALPLFLSLLLYQGPKKDEFNSGRDLKNVVIVQPNIDPYDGKFDGGASFVPYTKQILNMIHASDSLIDQKTRWVIWPETSIQKRGGYFRESDLDNEPNFRMVKRFLKRHPQVTLVAGISTWDTVDITKPYVTNPYFRNDIGFYKKYNASIMATSDTFAIYHKSKLVPGVEKTPFPKVMKVLVDLIDFDGSGDFGISPGPKVFTNDEGVSMAPTICYESIYGEHVAKFVQIGANFISIITNDGWWGDTPGFKQHNLYARLRAIENRRMVLRSANTGISCIIDSYGNELVNTDWWVADAFKHSVKGSKKITFYTNHGDWIGVFSFILSILAILILLVKTYIR